MSVTVDEILELPAQTKLTVPASFIDENGHMNIGRYLEIGGTALWTRSADELGMGQPYIDDRDKSTFTVEHHIRYLAEIREGEEVSVHVQVIERSAKLMLAASYIVNRTRPALSCVVESLAIHIDMETRRSSEFPDDIAALLDSAIEADRRSWEPPISGALRLS